MKHQWTSLCGAVLLLFLFGMGPKAGWAEEGDLPPPAVNQDSTPDAKTENPPAASKDELPTPEKQVKDEALPEASQEVPAPSAKPAPETKLAPLVENPPSPPASSASPSPELVTKAPPPKDQEKAPPTAAPAIVGNEEKKENFYLPPPSGGEFGNNYAVPIPAQAGAGPSGEGGSQYSAMEGSSDEMEETASRRYPFSLMAGLSSRDYPTQLIAGRTIGAEVGASFRLLNFTSNFSLHALGSVSSFNIGNIGELQNVQDITFHFGALLEWDLTSKISLFGSYLRRNNTITTAPTSGMPSGQLISQLTYIQETPTFYPGFAVQYDFYQIPHARVGARFYVEGYANAFNYASLMLNISMEPDHARRLPITGTEAE